jgi:hypothetical protein
MQYHPELTRVLAEERRRNLLDDANTRRAIRNRKAARRAARRFLSLRSRAAPPAGPSRLSPRAKSA